MGDGSTADLAGSSSYDLIPSLMFSTYSLKINYLFSTYSLKFCYSQAMARSPRNRSLLDQRLSAWKAVPPASPPRGWLRAIRETLGMPRKTVALRLGITDQAVAAMEQSEADGSIRLDTLRRAAEALDCTLVYAVVPDTSLEEIVDQRAHEVARRQVDRVQHSMLLEDQQGGADEADRLTDELAEQTKQSPSLWRE
jgi:predicted DNA-binding mobile mystery protein A